LRALHGLVQLWGRNDVAYNRAVPAGRNALVLIVEDDERLRAMYRDALMVSGFLVVGVADGIEALRFVDGTAPAAVVLDLGLPRVSGRDVQRELAAHPQTRDIPIVVVTGESTEIDHLRFDCVLRKPIDPADLVEAVQKCLRGRRTHR
jgi:CheY-like chemotaxis protein